MFRWTPWMTVDSMNRVHVWEESIQHRPYTLVWPVHLSFYLFLLYPLSHYSEYFSSDIAKIVEVRQDLTLFVLLNLVLRDTSLRRMGGISAVLYSDISGHYSSRQGQESPLRTGGVLPLVTGKLPSAVAKVCEASELTRAPAAEEQSLPVWPWGGVR